MDGVLMENGPFQAQKDGSLKLLDTGWNDNINMIYCKYEIKCANVSSGPTSGNRL